MSAIFERLGRFAARRRVLLMVLYAAASLFFLWRSASIHMETSLTELLPRGTPSADDFRDLIEAEETVDRLFITVGREPAAEDPEEEAPALADAAEGLSDSLRSSGLVKEVRFGIDEEEIALLARRGIEHLPVLMEVDRAAEVAARLDPGRVREAVERIRLRATMPGFAGLAEEMSAVDPLGLLPLLRLPKGVPGGVRPDPETGLFLSEDGRRLLIVAEAARPPTEIAFSRKLMDEVEAIESRLRRETADGDRLRFDHAGGHLFALEDERRVRHDAASTSLLSAAGLAFVYLFVVRRPSLWLAILVPLVTSTVWTLGIASIYPGRLNMVTVAFAAILLGIGDDAMLYIYLREREERRRGTAAPASVAAALGAMGPAVCVATLTTAIAFFALSFVRFRGLAELGLVSAMGMVNLLVGVLLFFPAALAILAEREQHHPGVTLRLPVKALLAVHDWSARRRWLILAPAGILTALMIFSAAGVRVATDLRSIRGEDPAEEALRRVLAPFGSAASAETMVVIHGSRSTTGAGQRQRIEAGLEAAAALDPLCREWIAAGRVAGCDSPSATLPPESTQRARFEVCSRLPWDEAIRSIETEARAAGINETFLAPFLNAARAYRDYEAVRIDADPGQFGAIGLPRTTIYFADSLEAAGLAEEVRRRLQDRPARIASVALVSADLSRIIAEDFRLAVWLVAGSIALLAIAAFRRIGLFLLVVAPVGIGIVWMLGVIRLAGIELNLMTLMGLPIVFGLGVDFGVYLIDRWSRGSETSRETLEGVGPPMIVTGLTTLAGFAALLSADLAGLRSLGLAVVLGTSLTMAAALFILPLLLPRRS